MPKAKVLKCFEQLAAAKAGTKRKQAQAAEHKSRSHKLASIPLAQVMQWFDQLAALSSQFELCQDKKDRAVATSGRLNEEQDKV